MTFVEPVETDKKHEFAETGANLRRAQGTGFQVVSFEQRVLNNLSAF